MFSIFGANKTDTDTQCPQIKQNTSFQNFNNRPFLRKKLKTESLAHRPNPCHVQDDSDSDYQPSEDKPSIMDNILKRTANFMQSSHSETKKEYAKERSDKKQNSKYSSPRRDRSEDYRGTYAM